MGFFRWFFWVFLGGFLLPTLAAGQPGPAAPAAADRELGEPRPRGERLHVRGGGGRSGHSQSGQASARRASTAR